MLLVRWLSQSELHTWMSAQGLSTTFVLLFTLMFFCWSTLLFSTFQFVNFLPVWNFSINQFCPSVNQSCAPCRTLTVPDLRLRDDRALHYLEQIFQASLFGAGPWAKPFEPVKRCPALRSYPNGRDLCRDLIIRTNFRCTYDQCFIPPRLNLILFHLLH